MIFTSHEISQKFHSDAQIVVCHDEVLEQLKKLPSNTFKLIASSPPYNIGKSYEKQVGLDAYIGWQEDVISEMSRITREDGSIVWQVGNHVNKGEVFPLDIYFYPIFKKTGLEAEKSNCLAL